MRSIFFLAFIPGTLAVLMIVFVKEKKLEKTPAEKTKIQIKNFPPSYWKYLFVTALFGIGNSTNVFLILQTKTIGTSLIVTIVIYAFYNLIAALSSYPSGALSDRLGRKHILLFSFVIFVLVYLGFAISNNIFLLGFLFILYGIYQGIFRSVGKAFATDFVPPRLRASGIGWYSTTVGLSSLVASIIAGLLWDKVDHSAVFFYGAFWAIVGTIALIFLTSNKRINHQTPY